MKKFLMKITSICIALILCLMMLPMQALAAAPTDEFYRDSNGDIRIAADTAVVGTETVRFQWFSSGTTTQFGLSHAVLINPTDHSEDAVVVHSNFLPALPVTVGNYTLMAYKDNDYADARAVSGPGTVIVDNPMDSFTATARTQYLPSEYILSIAIPANCVDRSLGSATLLTMTFEIKKTSEADTAYQPLVGNKTPGNPSGANFDIKSLLDMTTPSTTSYTIRANCMGKSNTTLVDVAVPGVTASAGAGGSISPNGAVPVEYNEDQSFTITPDTGYYISQVLVDGVNNSVAVTSGNYTFANVQGYHTIAASFAPIISLGAQTIAVTAPVTGAAAQSAIAAGTGYTGAIAWTNVTDGGAHSGAFADSKVYKATVALTSTTGYKWPATAPTITVTGQVVQNAAVTGTGMGNTLTFDVTFAATTVPSPVYTISFNANGGSVTQTSAQTGADGKLTTLPTPTRSGYSFAGWYTAASGGTQVTTATIFTANTEIFAHWTYTDGNNSSSSGSSAPTSTPATTVSGNTVKPSPVTTNGTTTVTVKSDELTKAADNAVKAAGVSGVSVVAISFTTPNGSTASQVTLPKAGMTGLADKEIDELVISDGKTTFVFDQKAIETIGSKATGDISINISQVPESKLTDAQKKAVNSRPVYDFSITSGSTKLTDFGAGKVGVTVPYTLAAGENPNSVVVYHIDGNGKLKIIENGVYDPTSKTVSFSTTHFSLYVIGYNLVNFTDVPADFWGKDYIEKAAARGLVAGIGNKLYQPDRSISRAEFVQMIANVLKLSDAKAGTAEYPDVASDAWYYNAVMSAKSAGLLDKFTGEFKPNEPITREEMAAILTPVLKQSRIVTGTYAINLKGTYNDFDRMSEDYLDDIMVVTVSKLMQGIGDGKFDPAGVTTRAQAATVQIKLLEMLNK